MNNLKGDPRGIAFKDAWTMFRSEREAVDDRTHANLLKTKVHPVMAAVMLNW